MAKRREPAEMPAYLEQRERDARLRPEGHPDGPPEAAFDTGAGRWYHLNALGRRVWHECPEGFEYDDAGALCPLTPPAAEESNGERE